MDGHRQNGRSDVRQSDHARETSQAHVTHRVVGRSIGG
jgi:hypothetical protein